MAEQLTLFGGPASPKPSRRRDFDTGRQAARTPGLISVGESRGDPGYEGFDQSRTQQLPMFLTAREVMYNYRAADGDRQRRLVQKPIPHVEEETDLDLMDRKLFEASVAPHPGIHGSGLRKRLREDRYALEKPVMVQHAGYDPITEDTYTHTGQAGLDPDDRGVWGTDARPQIINGLHRVAVMARDAPDTPIPVTHSTVASVFKKREARLAKYGTWKGASDQVL